MKKLNGLCEGEVIASREKYGTNQLSRRKTKSFLRKFFENLCDPIIKILLIVIQKYQIMRILFVRIE